VSEPISPAGPPAEITHLVRERAEARTKQYWKRADSLKAEIEAAGWKVVDRGSKTSVSLAAPGTVTVGDEVRYGSAAAVPSRLDEPATTPISVVMLASEAPEALSRLLSALRDHAPTGTQVVVVANDPSAAQEAALAPDSADRVRIGGLDPEILRTSTRLGTAAALNIGLIRASGDVVVLADASAWPTGDAISPLVEALLDSAVAVVGGFGLAAAEPGLLQPTALVRTDETDVVALEAGWIAFRRTDLAALGPLDERFVVPAWLDVLWTLRLRAGLDPVLNDADADDAADDAGPEEALAGLEAEPPALPEPRKAVRLALPLSRAETRWPPERSRMARRNMYRVLASFGWRDDLT
jgi:glycosyltransferase involved in cell wall biosynthesis